MRKLFIGVMVVGLLMVPVLVGQKQEAGAASEATLARGKYLVENVGLCGDCHTPHDDKGEPIKEQWLKGAPLAFKPTVKMPAFADKAPPIAGLPGWTKAAGIKFMMTGVNRKGAMARPLMPQYRFNKADAVAIVEYLKSLEAK